MRAFGVLAKRDDGVDGAAARWWRFANLLAMTALFAGILLTGVSVWFLGAVALAGATSVAYTFNFHVPAALVRMFAVTRTAAKYGERVFGHKAALLDQVARRAALFASMSAAPKVRRAGWQLGDQDRLADFIDDVEDVDYAGLRADLPSAALLAALAVLAVGTLVVTPPALPAILVLLAGAAAIARWLAPRMAEDWRSARKARRAACRQLGAGLAAAAPLQAEHAWRSTLAASFDDFADAGRHIVRLRRDVGMLDAALSLTGPLAAFGVLAAAWSTGARGDALLPGGFVAFAWLAWGESVQVASRVLLARVKEAAARQSLAGWTADGSRSHEAAGPLPSRLRKLEIVGLRRHAPDGRRLEGELDVVLSVGRPAVLTGPSGSGKTSLLKELAGWLDDHDDGEILGDGAVLSPATRRSLACLSLHDAAILADTVRENLFAPAATDADCWAALDAVEMGDRIRAAGGLDGWITQDRLSLGEAQRLNLARALLSPLPIVLLDEPGEHLDPDQAARILERIGTLLDDRILLVSSHASIPAWQHAQLIKLGGVRALQE